MDGRFLWVHPNLNLIFFDFIWFHYILQNVTLYFDAKNLFIICLFFKLFCSQIAITNPLEVIKIRTQTQPVALPRALSFLSAQQTSQPGMLQLARNIGWKGLYAGSFATLCRDFPGMCIFQGVYQTTRWKLSEQYGIKSSATTVLTSCIVGYTAATWCTIPIDVMKSRYSW